MLTPLIIFFSNLKPNTEVPKLVMYIYLFNYYFLGGGGGVVKGQLKMIIFLYMKHKLGTAQPLLIHNDNILVLMQKCADILHSACYKQLRRRFRQQ